MRLLFVILFVAGSWFGFAVGDSLRSAYDTGFSTIPGMVMTIVMGGLCVSLPSWIARLSLKVKRLRKAMSFISFELEFGREAMQAKLDEQLSIRANEVRQAAEEQMRHQHIGQAAYNASRYNMFQNRETFEQTAERLKEAFGRAQAHFYTLYDQSEAVAPFLHLLLKERNWKAYAGEPELPKDLAS